jgi:methyltransferase (TIGR00027 family)
VPTQPRPSLTARNVAAVRRRVDRPTVVGGDADGDDRLTHSLRAPVPLQLPGLVHYIRARTAFFDHTLLDACAAGLGQVVIVGAGYDGRALRFRQPDVTFFEVDHPATQADKRARLRTLGIDSAHIRFVPVDLRRDSLARQLEAAGHAATEPTHFLCEGLTSYLPLQGLRSLVRTVADRAAALSTLAIDFVEPAHTRPLGSRLLLRAVKAGTAVMGERILTLLTGSEAKQLLVDEGWGMVTLDAGSRGLPAIFAVAQMPARDP